jgi:glycosyltransferase involved in cell wall biosynthesis
LKLLFFITEDWYFWSHRLPLARAARQSGFDVVLVTRVSEHAERIRAEGIKLVPIDIRRRGRNPLRELGLLAQLARIYRAERPDLVHHVALKPVLYGAIAARLAGVRAKVSALAGLGYVFLATHLKGRLLRAWVRLAYRLLLNGRNSRTIVQNDDDRAMLVGGGVLRPESVVVIRGSGVDLRRFVPADETPGAAVVVLVSRMLRDKGVIEFVEAARALRLGGATARFALVGDADPENPTTLTVDQLRAWQQEGVIEWWGWRDDTERVFAQSHIVCLPSYREGLPKVLLEAAACGRAIVTTDVPGCRDVVRDGDNGLLVPPRDAAALARALAALLADPERRRRMGRRGRQIVESEFSVERVNAETLAVYRQLLATGT